MDVPDRLPFEVAARSWVHGVRLDIDHQIQPVQRVPATKPGQSTVRPFVRVHPRDLLLYQALVDSLHEPLESALGSREEVFAYRLSPLECDDPFEGSPRWRHYNAALHELAVGDLDGYVIEGDVSSFFLNIDLDELERRLLEIDCAGAVVRDLGALLRGWAAQGIRGLPQGVLPSSPLANFYLSLLDQFFRSEAVPFVRYMDDFAARCPSHHASRRLLDQIEELLYDDGLSLGGGKTAIVRAENVLKRFTPEEGLDGVISALQEEDYAPGPEEIEEIRLAEVCALFDAAIAALNEDEYRRSDLTFALRALAQAKDPHAIADIPQMLLRIPGLTPVACRYLETMAGTDHRGLVTTALVALTTDRFHRAQEWLNILRAIQVIPERKGGQLVSLLTELVLSHEHPLVRARALLAWGAQSEPEDFEVVDQFFANEARPWLQYPVVAVQAKAEAQREERYQRWSGEGRGVARLAESVKSQRFAWSKS
ncbi:MAG TPA: RNA-directed DNA polymerase [Solirubrobacterales bacterium]|nr:RNA-directed DNA polymerase [Solirubrobacterales bacterium]